jgi:hypothetical protein
MTADSKTCLVSTLHDPAGRMLPFLESALPFLRRLYSAMDVIATAGTDSRTVDALRLGGVQVSRDGTAEIGSNRRQALARGMAHEDTGFLHYCDLDRLLHWACHHPEELRMTVLEDIPAADFLVLGRTPAAFADHPAAQRELESLTNRIFSHVFGVEMDVTAGSCGLSRRAASAVQRYSQEPTNATDTEWPMIISRLAPADVTVSYLQVQGLEYETTTFYGPEALIAADSSDNWARRTTLARDSIEAVLRLSRYPENVRGKLSTS